MISDCDKVENIMGKEKMLVTSIFSFSHNAFKRFLFQGRQNSGVCDKDSTSLNRNFLAFLKFSRFNVLLYGNCFFVVCMTLKIESFKTIFKKEVLEIKKKKKVLKALEYEIFTHFQIHHFETVPNSKKLQTTT